MPDTHASDATYQEGQQTAFEVALVTFLGLMKPEVRQQFCDGFARNIETFDVFTLATPVSDDWRKGLTETAARLQGLVSRALPPKTPGQSSS